MADGRTDERTAAVAVAACTGLAAGRSVEELLAGAQALGALDGTAIDEATARRLLKLTVVRVRPDQAEGVAGL